MADKNKSIFAVAGTLACTAILFTVVGSAAFDAVTGGLPAIKQTTDGFARNALYKYILTIKTVEGIK